MKKIKFVSFMLACLMLASVMMATASAVTINFIPKTENQKLYGIPANSEIKTVGNAYPNAIVSVYDKNGELVGPASSKKVGTGFKVKLNASLYNVVVMGDVDGDGMIRPLDYIAVKRAVLNKTNSQYQLSELAKEAIGIKNNGEVRALNYLLIKRAYLGTYDINNAYTCAPYDPAESESGWTPGWV